MTYRGYGAYGYGGGVGQSPGSGEGKAGGGRLSGRGAQHQATTHRGRGGAAFSGRGGSGNSMGGRGGGKRKGFDHSSESGDSKKFKFSNAWQFSSSTDQCISVKVSPEGDVYTSQVDFSIGVAPPIWGAGRRECFALKTPEEVPRFFERLADVYATSTFLANQCSSCLSLNSDHDISEKKVYILGDQFIPWRVGEGGDCVPTIRVQNADFQQLKNVLFAQKKSGFEPPQGSVFAVGLLTHLARIGNAAFWDHFLDFSGWCQRHFGAVAWPFIPPFPRSISANCLVTLHQFLVEMQGRYMGCTLGKRDPIYSLWKPLDFTSNENGIAKVKIVAPNVCMKSSGGEKILICPENGLPGFEDDFSKGIPKQLETKFFGELLKTIAANVPASLAIVVPKSSALEEGARREAAPPAPEKAASGLPTVFLIGNSIAKRVAGPLRNLAKGKVNVELTYRKESPWEGPRLIVPKAKGEKDVLLLMFLGNEIFLKKEHFFSNGRCHLEAPAYHNDGTAAALVDNLCRTLTTVQSTYKGAIKILGPLPRHLTKCCKNPSHALAKSAVFLSTLHYIELWNNFLAVHPKLRVFKNTEVIPFPLVFGDVFHNGWLLDGVHLDEIPNHKLASFIGTLSGRDVGMPDPLPAGVESFTTWAAMQPKPRSVSGGSGGKTAAAVNNTAPPASSGAAAQGQSSGPEKAKNPGRQQAGGNSAAGGELADYVSDPDEDSMDHSSGKEPEVDKEDMEIEESMRSFDKACGKL